MSNFFEKALQTFAWLKIVASPLLFSCIVAALIYFPFRATWALVAAILVIVTGIWVGIIFANKVSKKNGSLWFISQIMSSPELDEKKEQSK